MIALTALPTALHAVPVGGPSMPRPVEDSEAELDSTEIAAMALAGQAMRTESVAEAEVMLQRALAMVPQPGEARGRIACGFAARLYQESNEDPAWNRKALAAADECLRQRPDDAMAQMLAGLANVTDGQPRRGGLLLNAAIRSNPELLADQEVAGMQRVFRRLAYANEGALLVELRGLLVKAGFGKSDPRFFGDMVIEAIADAVTRNANSEAVALLPQIVSPEYGLRLLIDRRFQPIWPMVEHWAGGDLKKQRDAMVAAARAEFRIDPSIENRGILATALANAGGRTEAIALLGQAIDDPRLWDEDRFHISMLTGRYARLLLFEDRLAEAVAAAERMGRANPGAQYPYARNLMPNFALVLIQAGRNQEALELIAREMPPPGSLEDLISFGFYAALRYCALHRLGKTREAAREALLLDTRFATNGGARAIRAACSTDARTAQSLWSAQIGSGATVAVENPGQLLTLYRAQLGIRTLDMLDLFGADGLIRDSEPLKVAYAGFARELPASYLPALRMWDDTAATTAAVAAVTP